MKFKKQIIFIFWWLLAVGIAGLLVAAVKQKNASVCSDIRVEIQDIEGHVFVDEQDIKHRLYVNGAQKGNSIRNINLRTLETIIKKGAWIKNAELYFDNNNVLQVIIKEREPIARVFTINGHSFYIDSSGIRLPLSNDYTAHVPVFTSFTSDNKKLSAPDSLLLNDIKKLAVFIQQDSFWNAQVSQVNITPQTTFEMIPVVGNQIIKLGNADSLESKFNRLHQFYKQVWAKTGFEKYESVSVEFSGQVVATKRGEPKPYIDSALAYRIVKAMRNGVDILKDSTMQFHDMEVPQKNISNNILNQTLPSIFDTTRIINDNGDAQKNVVNSTNQNNKSTTANTPKALMPKSIRKQ